MYQEMGAEAFERVLEQGAKLLRKRLAPWFASNRQADSLRFKDLFRYAAKHGLMDTDSVERWFAYRDDRSESAGFTEKTRKLMPAFIDDANALADIIDQANDD